MAEFKRRHNNLSFVYEEGHRDRPKAEKVFHDYLKGIYALEAEFEKTGVPKFSAIDKTPTKIPNDGISQIARIQEHPQLEKIFRGLTGFKGELNGMIYGTDFKDGFYVTIDQEHWNGAKAIHIPFNHPFYAYVFDSILVDHAVKERIIAHDNSRVSGGPYYSQYVEFGPNSISSRMYFPSIPENSIFVKKGILKS